LRDPEEDKEIGDESPQKGAMRVVRRRSWVMPQTRARKTPPLSRGKPGIKLNRPSTRLIYTRYLARARSGSISRKTDWNRKKKAARPKLTAGPKTQIQD